MGSIERYIFRTTIGAFVLVLVSLTGIIWISQAIRDIDLMTSKGQTMIAFLGITGLLLPMLMMLIAPIALFTAVAYVLHRLATDSEIIVLNAAGMSPWRQFRAFLAVGGAVSLFVALTAAYVSPQSLRLLRTWATEVRADLVSYIVQPGRFITIEPGLTFHIRERLPNGVLLGIMVDDQRDPKEQATFLAEQGQIIKNDTGTFLLLEQGSVQRLASNQRDPALITFDRYAFDLSSFGGAPTVRYSARERFLWELGEPATGAAAAEDARKMRAELNDRIVSAIYPLAFAVIAFAFLGAPRTTRQSRAMSMAGAALAVLLLRLLGMGSTIIGVRTPALLALPYVAFAAALGVSLWVISRGVIIEPPAAIGNAITRLGERFARRASAAAT